MVQHFPINRDGVEELYRSRQVNFRATPEVYQLAKYRSEEYGLSMSAYVNKVIMQDVGLRDDVLYDQADAYYRIMRELNALHQEVLSLREDLGSR